MNCLTSGYSSRAFSHTLFFMGIFFVLSFLQAANQVNSHDLVLASHSLSLEDRYTNKWVNDVFKDNILLTIAYLSGKEQKNASPDWDTIGKPQAYEFTLKPGEIFAFHDKELPAYAKNVVKTTNAHYTASEGFKSDGYLTGDGVCHLASLFYITAKNAGLDAVAPVNHDFAIIPEIDKKYGVAIYADPTNPAASMQQNLYIRNNKSTPVTFKIVYNGKDLTIQINKKV